MVYYNVNSHIKCHFQHKCWIYHDAMNPCRGMELQFHAVNGQPYAPCFCHLWERAPGTFPYEAGWDPDLDWTIWKNFPFSRVAWSLDAADIMEKNTYSI
jgi:hypothetical protein